MGVDFVSYRAVYHGYKRQGMVSVMDSKTKHEDFDHTIMKLTEGTYTMVDGKVASKCLIKKFAADETKFRLFSLLQNIKHHGILSAENFYDEGGQPRFVFSWANGSIEAWFRSGEAQTNKMIKTSMRGRYLSSRFREMVIDICSALEHLFKHRIYPIKFGAENILIWKADISNRYFPKLLIIEVEGPDGINVESRKKYLWTQVKDTIISLFNHCGNTNIPIDPVTLSFFNYIGISSVAELENYPDTWSDVQKGNFLLRFMSGDKVSTRGSVQHVGITWPKTSLGTLQSPVCEMMTYDKGRTLSSNYDDKDPYDFLRLCKNLVKHWRVLDPSVKVACRCSWLFLMQKMDSWNPQIWCILYDIFRKAQRPAGKKQLRIS